MRFHPNIIFDFFIPRSCPSCKTRLAPNENYICKLCLNEINNVPKNLLDEEYNKSFKSEKIIDDIFSLFLFDEDSPIRNLIHELKYNRKFMYGKFLGKLIAKEITKTKPNWKFDGIFAVPLHPSKKVTRGYNQSDFIVKGISSVLNIPIYSKYLKRKRATPSQTNLNVMERKRNVANAFSVKKNIKLNEKSFIIVDDIITTGATISEAASKLKEMGAQTIYAVSAALTSFDTTFSREHLNQE
ncbi:MAG: ComF family protein [Melioribacteraceae bacterium]|nr:ComF family protein [Melioribacteraceae bacterium]MCO6472187.1 ComF family protein [Melioribacteraceae bacterium]MDD3557429.1 ComF family protein [Melioribacteraceae bacterium]